MHDEDLYAERLLELGAHDYVTKQEEPAEFLRALRRVVAGDIHLSRSLSVRARHGCVTAGERNGESLATLTTREHDVLGLVARGMDAHEISAALGMIPRPSTRTAATSARNSTSPTPWHPVRYAGTLGREHRRSRPAGNERRSASRRSPSSRASAANHSPRWRAWPNRCW